MAVAVEMDFPGAPLEQYDQVLDKMGLAPRGAGPAGAISHWVAKTDDGIRIVDVWESKERYGQFAEEQIAPYAMEAGFPNEPQVHFYEVHNYFTPG